MLFSPRLVDLVVKAGAVTEEANECTAFNNQASTPPNHSATIEM